MGRIMLEDVRKSFGPVEVIKGADLDIEDGSFVVFVGPSGCGKSTCCASSRDWRTSPAAASSSTGRTW